jgi:hypothetical protein
MVVFKDLWNNHPINESVEFPCIAPRDMQNIEGKLIMAGAPMYPNQCAVRLSIALKRAGAKPISGLATCGAHPPEEMHYVNATQVANALARGAVEGLAPVQKLTGTEPAHFYPLLFGRTGVVYFQDYWQRSSDRPGQPTGDHVDVWNGYRSSAKWLMEWFSWLGYYSNYAHAREIWFWEVK